MGGIIVLILFILVLGILSSCIRIVPQANAYVVERLGAYQGTWAVGIHFKVPFMSLLKYLTAIGLVKNRNTSDTATNSVFCSLIGNHVFW